MSTQCEICAWRSLQEIRKEVLYFQEMVLVELRVFLHELMLRRGHLVSTVNQI